MTRKEYIEEYDRYIRNSKVVSLIETCLPCNSVYHPKVGFSFGLPEITFEVYQTKGNLKYISEDPNNPERLAEHNIRWFAPDISLSIPFSADPITDEEKVMNNSYFAISFAGHGETKENQALIIRLYREAFDIVEELNKIKKDIWKACKEIDIEYYAKEHGPIPPILIKDRADMVAAIKRLDIDPAKIPMAQVKIAFGYCPIDAVEAIMNYINKNQDSGDLDKEVAAVFEKFPGLKEQVNY